MDKHLNQVTWKSLQKLGMVGTTANFIWGTSAPFMPSEVIEQVEHTQEICKPHSNFHLA